MSKDPRDRSRQLGSTEKRDIISLPLPPWAKDLQQHQEINVQGKPQTVNSVEVRQDLPSDPQGISRQPGAAATGERRVFSQAGQLSEGRQDVLAVIDGDGKAQGLERKKEKKRRCRGKPGANSKKQRDRRRRFRKKRNLECTVRDVRVLTQLFAGCRNKPSAVAYSRLRELVCSFFFWCFVRL